MTSPIITIRFTTGHHLRELFYQFGSRIGHEAYAKLSPTLAAALYQEDADWRVACQIAVRALVNLNTNEHIIHTERTAEVNAAINALVEIYLADGC